MKFKLCGLRESEGAAFFGSRGSILATAATALVLAHPFGGGALAQPPDAPKIGNPTAIPAAVRPGAIEAQLEVEIAPGVEMAPAVISPYEPEQPEGADAIEFLLSEIALDGARSVPEDRIRALFAGRIGATVRLADIFAIARSITRLYADEGYPLSLAYVPVQEIENGSVRIRIIEGYIGSVDVSGAPPRLAAKLTKLGEKIMAERPLTQKTLERYLLLANELPGTKVTGILQRADAPGGGVGLAFKTTEKRLDVAAAVNNRASRAVGREQFNGRLKVSGLATGGDSLRFLAVQSVRVEELTFFAGGYSTSIGSEGLRLDLSATRSEAAPGVPLLRDLGFETTGWTAGAGLSYPLILNRSHRLSVSGGASWKEFRSAFGVDPNTRDVLWTSEIGAAYRFDDGLDGSNSIAVSLVRGWDIFDATPAGSPLASRQGAGGEFLAFIADVGRVQKLGDRVDFSLSVKAQTANNPLLSSEQCGFGGAGFGRGYDPFEIAGDRCIVGLAEISAQPAFLQFGKFAARPFASFDAGAVRQNGPLAAGESRTASRYSVAGGVRMNLTRHVSGSLEVGVPLKGVVRQEGDDDPRFFFALEARY